MSDPKPPVPEWVSKLVAEHCPLNPYNHEGENARLNALAFLAAVLRHAAGTNEDDGDMGELLRWAAAMEGEK